MSLLVATNVASTGACVERSLHRPCQRAGESRHCGWAKGDSAEAKAARSDLLARGRAAPFDVRAITHGQAMLLETDAGRRPPPSMAGSSEWVRFRSAHRRCVWRPFACHPFGLQPFGGKTAVGHRRLGVAARRVVTRWVSSLNAHQWNQTWSIGEMILLVVHAEIALVSTSPRYASSSHCDTLRDVLHSTPAAFAARKLRAWICGS